MYECTTRGFTVWLAGVSRTAVPHPPGSPSFTARPRPREVIAMSATVQARGPKNMLAGKRPLPAHITVYLFVIVPFLALVTAVPLAWGWGLTWLDLALAAGFYVFTCLGTTVGFHRYFTHGSFKAKRPLRLALAVAGSLAVQCPILHWVADHRRHHAYSDQEGDPHSPWLFGT